MMVELTTKEEELRKEEEKKKKQRRREIATFKTFCPLHDCGDGCSHGDDAAC